VSAADNKPVIGGRRHPDVLVVGTDLRYRLFGATLLVAGLIGVVFGMDATTVDVGLGIVMLAVSAALFAGGVLLVPYTRRVTVDTRKQAVTVSRRIGPWSSSDTYSFGDVESVRIWREKMPSGEGSEDHVFRACLCVGDRLALFAQSRGYPSTRQEADLVAGAIGCRLDDTIDSLSDDLLSAEKSRDVPPWALPLGLILLAVLFYIATLFV